MTATTEDLIARLEAETEDFVALGLRHVSYVNPDGPESAQALRALQQEVEQKDSALAVCAQALLEVKMAQSRGSGWYTRGDRGLYEQVDMWVRRGETAIEQARSALTGSAQG